MIVKIDNTIKNLIMNNSEFSKLFIDNCFNSKFLAIEKDNSKIIGICFVGGLLNSNGIEINEKFRGKGIAKKLLDEVLNECNKQKISFLTGVFKPTNIISIKTHLKIGYKPVFTIFYNIDEGQEIVVINPFNKKGHLFFNLMRFLNTRIGNTIFSLLWILLNPLLKNIIAFSGNKIPKIDFFNSIKKFEKVEITMKNFSTKF
jgi:GNAT superfamily N-acetyltransferase